MGAWTLRFLSSGSVGAVWGGGSGYASLRCSVQAVWAGSESWSLAFSSVWLSLESLRGIELGALVFVCCLNQQTLQKAFNFLCFCFFYIFIMKHNKKVKKIF